MGQLAVSLFLEVHWFLCTIHIYIIPQRKIWNSQLHPCGELEMPILSIFLIGNLKIFSSAWWWNEWWVKAVAFLFPPCLWDFLPWHWQVCITFSCIWCFYLFIYFSISNHVKVLCLFFKTENHKGVIQIVTICVFKFPELYESAFWYVIVSK